MKLFSAIMSIYLLGLVVVPCADVHAENDSVNTHFETVDHSENHVDTCSPFCVCDCCQTVSQPATRNYFTSFPMLIGTTTPFIQASEFSVPITLWRPPKI